MAAALGIARGHRGAIKVYSELGRGSTFKVFLPTSTGSVAASRGEPRRQADWHGSGCILVVDDERTVRDFATSVLQSHGFETLVARDGVEALEVLAGEGHRISVVLLDLAMPRMDGQQTFARVRTEYPQLRTVLMSGYNEQDATEQFIGKGLAGFLAKPFLVADLMGAVHAALKSTER